MEESKPKITKKWLDELTYRVIGAAIEVQKHMGHGLLEGTYQRCFEHELRLIGLRCRTELSVPVVYKGLDVMADLRCDVLVEDCFVVELKTVENILPIHRAQVMSYMTLLRAHKGIVINFNAYNIFKLGQETFVNDSYKDLPD
ncbi:MAG: GxxExxY protein, partial [Bacteroidetes bacterium]|nr:GxxExxY protein [Bacteroidota bacterium]